MQLLSDYFNSKPVQTARDSTGKDFETVVKGEKLSLDKISTLLDLKSRT
jgi:hypothetical protein